AGPGSSEGVPVPGSERGVGPLQPAARLVQSGGLGTAGNAGRGSAQEVAPRVVETAPGPEPLTGGDADPRHRGAGPAPRDVGLVGGDAAGSDVESHRAVFQLAPIVADGVAQRV